jgi:hypothetical protein
VRGASGAALPGVKGIFNQLWARTFNETGLSLMAPWAESSTASQRRESDSSGRARPEASHHTEKSSHAKASIEEGAES